MRVCFGLQAVIRCNLLERPSCGPSRHLRNVRFVEMGPPCGITESREPRRKGADVISVGATRCSSDCAFEKAASRNAGAILFLFGGMAKIVLSFALEDRRFFWAVLISGIVSITLAVIIFMNWPVSAISALGILLGVELISDGISSLAMAFSDDGEEAQSA